MTATYEVSRSRDALAGGGGLLAILSDAECARWQALRSAEGRDAFLAARVLARRLVGDWLEVDPKSVRFVQRCEMCGGPHGRPTVDGHPGCQVSWSHDGSWAAAVVDSHPCGIDVVDVVALGSELPWGAMTLGERASCEAAATPSVAFATLWARKEAIVKAGFTHLGGIAELDVSLAPPTLGTAPCRGVELIDLRVEDSSGVVAARASVVADSVPPR